MIVRVESLDDPRLDAYARLTEVQLRSKLEPAQGIFIAESDKVVKRALAGGMEPLSLLMEEKWLPVMQPVIDDMARRFPDAPAFVAPEDVYKRQDAGGSRRRRRGGQDVASGRTSLRAGRRSGPADQISRQDSQTLGDSGKGGDVYKRQGRASSRRCGSARPCRPTATIRP